MSDGYAFTLAICFGLLIILGIYSGGKAVFEFLTAIGHHSREELAEDGHIEEPSKPFPTCFDDEEWGKE